MKTESAVSDLFIYRAFILILFRVNSNLILCNVRYKSRSRKGNCKELHDKSS